MMFLSLLPEILLGATLAAGSGGLAYVKRDEISDKFKSFRKLPIETEDKKSPKHVVAYYIKHHKQLRTIMIASVDPSMVITHYKKQPITLHDYFKQFSQWEEMIQHHYDYIENNNRHFFSVFIPECREFFALFNRSISRPEDKDYMQKIGDGIHTYLPSTQSDPYDYFINSHDVKQLIIQYQKIFGMMYHFHSLHLAMVDERHKTSQDEISLSMEHTFSYVVSNGDMYGAEIDEELFEPALAIESVEEIETVEAEEVGETPLAPSIATRNFIESHSRILSSEMSFYKEVYSYEGISFVDGVTSHYTIIGDFLTSYQEGNTQQVHPQLRSTRRMHVMTDSFSKPEDNRPYKMVTINNYQPSQLQIHDPEFFFHYVKDKLPSDISTYLGPAHLRHVHDAKYMVFFRDSLFYGNFDQIKEMLELYFVNPKQEYFKDLPASELKFLKEEMALPENHIFYRSN